MKIVTSFVGALLLVGSLETSTAFSAAPGVISNQVLNEGSYCHLTFPAIRPDTLSSDRPVLKDASAGDIVDFYGPCDTDPLGEDQVHQQKLERQHRWRRSYSD